jgi:hypothetical protein
MKKIYAVLSVLFFTTIAYAGFQAFNGTTDLKIFNKIKCSTGLTCAKVGDTLTVTNTNVGVVQPQVASTTTTITSAQCGSTFVSNSADVMTLPEASTVLGCRLSFVCGTADDFDINPNDGTDQISVVNSVAAGAAAVITPSAGDAIRCTDIGSTIELEAVGANLWVEISVANGAWTDVN